MKYMTAMALALLLSACSEQIEESYPTWADAKRGGAVSRGWVPSFVPQSARNLNDLYDLDTSQQTLQFLVPPSEVPAMVSGFVRISPDDINAAVELTRKLGFISEPEVFVVCSSIRNGVLLVDRETGQTTYDTTIKWVDDDCS